MEYNKRVIKNYILISIIIVALSFVGLFFNEWIVPVTTFICAIFGSGCLALLLKSDPNKGNFTIYLVLRYVVMAIGLIASGFIVKYTMPEVIDKNRYFILIASALPYFIPSIALSITKVKKENHE